VELDKKQPVLEDSSLRSEHSEKTEFDWEKKIDLKACDFFVI
jgi:hypothetical protein